MFSIGLDKFLYSDRVYGEYKQPITIQKIRSITKKYLINMHKQGIRHEFKYVLNNIQARQVEEFVKKILKPDSSAEHGSYAVTSLYFDTPILGDYYDKLAGLKYRRKLRTRTYSKNLNFCGEKTWLEIKEKHDMNIVKKRRLVSFSLAGNILNGNTADFNDFFYFYKLKNYKPNLIVRYQRKAYTGNFLSPIRVTFDRNIEACKWREFEYNYVIMTPVKNNAVIMEVKFHNGMPWWFKELINRFGLSRSTFSKYTTAVDVINRFNPMPK